MKLVMALISNKDITKVMSALSNEGFFATRISTTGQFLADGHTAIYVGTDDEKVPHLFDVIKQNVTKRVVRQFGVESTLEGSLLKQPVDVEEYGAVAFVINVDEFRKL